MITCESSNHSIKNHFLFSQTRNKVQTIIVFFPWRVCHFISVEIVRYLYLSWLGREPLKTFLVCVRARRRLKDSWRYFKDKETSVKLFPPSLSPSFIYFLLVCFPESLERVLKVLIGEEPNTELRAAKGEKSIKNNNFNDRVASLQFPFMQ